MCRLSNTKNIVLALKPKTFLINLYSKKELYISFTVFFVNFILYMHCIIFFKLKPLKYNFKLKENSKKKKKKGK